MFWSAIKFLARSIDRAVNFSYVHRFGQTCETSNRVVLSQVKAVVQYLAVPTYVIAITAMGGDG